MRLNHLSRVTTAKHLSQDWNWLCCYKKNKNNEPLMCTFITFISKQRTTVTLIANPCGNIYNLVTEECEGLYPALLSNGCRGAAWKKSLLETKQLQCLSKGLLTSRNGGNQGLEHCCLPRRSEMCEHQREKGRQSNLWVRRARRTTELGDEKMVEMWWPKAAVSPAVWTPPIRSKSSFASGSHESLYPLSL